jgi:hypothetical protein
MEAGDEDEVFTSRTIRSSHFGTRMFVRGILVAKSEDMFVIEEEMATAEESEKNKLEIEFIHDAVLETMVEDAAVAARGMLQR